MTLNDGLQGMWHFTGNTNDDSANGWNWTNNGADLTSDMNSVSNQAYQFISSNSDYMENSSITISSSSDFTISCFAKLKTGTPADGYLLDSSAGRLVLSLKHSVNSGNIGVFDGTAWRNSGVAATLDTWVHYVFRFVGTTWYLYMNGVEVFSGTFSNPGIGGTTRLCRHSTSTGAHVDVDLDELRLYDRALSDYEIVQLYTGYDTEDSVVDTLGTGLEAGYHFTAGSFTDFSGNGNTATNNGTTGTTDKNSVADQARSFDGVNDTITTSITFSGETTSTLSVWASDTSWGNGWLSGKISGINDRFGVGIIGTDIYVLAENGAPGYGYVSISGLSTSTYHHFVVKFDGGAVGNANRLKLYIDNVEQTLTFTGTVSSSIAATNTFSLGNWPSVGHFSGKIDEPRYYTRVLTQDEINSLYFGYDAPVTNNLIQENEAYYKLDVSSGSQTDSTGNGNTGTVSGATYTGSGKINSGYSFDGTNDYISTPVSISGTTASSFSTWINWDGGTANPKAIMGTYTSGGSVGTTLLINTNSTVIYQAGLGNTTSPAISSGVWTHIVGVRTTTDTKLYINGVEAASLSGTPSSTETSDVHLGRSGLFNSWYFDGDIDETGIWTRGLTPTEVTALYNNDVGIQYPFSTATGYSNKVLGVVPSKVNGVAVADISKVNGI